MPMSRMKPLLWCLVFSLPFGAVAAWAQAERLDRIVAIVDDDVVLESELQDRLQTVMERLRQVGNRQQLPPAEVLHQQILDQLFSRACKFRLGGATGLE